MKFAHLSDCHIGSWREPALRDASTDAFCKAIDIALERNVDFIIISGDLFNTAQPGMEYLRTTVWKLKTCADSKVPVYGIAGSHDFSPSGKTMLDVLDAAGLCRNVARGTEVDGKLRLAFTIDEKTGIKLTGMVGRKGSLEREYYQSLDLPALEAEQGKKIFVFHSAVTELRPKGFEEVESVPLSCFPKGFVYYAGGHIHVVDQQRVEGHGLFGIPGPIFPNNFQELEKLKNGGFYIITDRVSLNSEEAFPNTNTSAFLRTFDIEYVPLPLWPVHSITINAKARTPIQIERAIREHAESIPPPPPTPPMQSRTIITLRVEGTLDQGSTGDIPWNSLHELFISKGAYCVIRNTSKLSSTELSPIFVETTSVEDIEEKLINEHAGQLRVFEKEKEKEIIKGFMHALASEKSEGETVGHFEERIIQAGTSIVLDRPQQ